MALTQISTQGIKDGTITGTDLATNIDLVDNQKIRFGDSPDLEIYHSGTASFISDVGGGVLKLTTDGLRVRNAADNQNMIKADQNDAVELYHNNALRLKTESYGISITGSLISSGTLQSNGGNIQLLSDSQKIFAGAGQDLGIFHDGTNSFIENTTGNLHIRPKAAEEGIKIIPDGAVELYYDGSKKFDTNNLGVRTHGTHFLNGDVHFANNGFTDGILWDKSASTMRWKDNNKALFGDGNDLKIYHNSSNNKSYIEESGSGNLVIRGSNIDILSGDGEACIQAIANGAVELYHDNSKKFETTSSGATVTGDLNATNDIIITGSGEFYGFDNSKIVLGHGRDLQIEHDGSASYIHNSTGVLAIQSDELHLTSKAGGEPYLKGFVNGAVELYYDNSKMLETTSAGAKVTGTLDVTGAIYTFNEFNMAGQGNKFIDTAHLNHTLHFRRINDGDNGHANQCTVSSDGVWSADFNDTSDEKLKENITTISDGAINIVKQLRPVNFDWKETDKANNVSGFIAQEIKTVLPNLVYGTEYDPTIIDEKTQCIKSTGYSVNTIGIVAHLTKALQEAISKIEVLETEVASLKAS